MPVKKSPSLIDTALSNSRRFYETHQLDALAQALPAKANVSPEAQARLAAAQKEGLNAAWVFPPLPTQREQTTQLVRACAASPASQLAAAHQYAEPWVQDMAVLREAEVHHRPTSAYALLYSSGKYPDSTRNLTAKQLGVLFQEKGWTGLTAHEYLVLQRVASEQHGDHRFDDYVPDLARSQWQWLLDNRVPKGCIMGYWNPTARRVEIGWCKPDNKNPRRGAHPTIVIPLA
jgi:hypothetical protein